MSGTKTVSFDTSGIVDGQSADAADVTTPFADAEQKLEDILNGVQAFNTINIGEETEITVATGTVTLTASHHTIDTEADAATDDLDTINGAAGDIAFIRLESASRLVTFKHGTGNINTVTGLDVTLASTNEVAVVLHDGTTAFVGFLGAGGSAADIGCRATQSSPGGDVTLTTGADGVIGFDGETYDTDTMHDNSTNNSRITINTTGRYVVSAYGDFASNATGYRRLTIRQDGTTTLTLRSAEAISGAAHSMEISATLNLTSGDYIELLAFQNSGGNLDFTDGVFAAQLIA